MNIKQAPCLARIVAPGSQYSGWIVSVLSATPVGEFLLPDGQLSFSSTGKPSWTCESLMHSMFNVELDFPKGKRRLARYAVIGDSYLRPLPGIDDTETTETSKPKELEAA